MRRRCGPHPEESILQELRGNPESVRRLASRVGVSRVGPMPPESADEPPRSGVFSIRSGRRPLTLAAMAAAMPPTPLPTTTMSYSWPTALSSSKRHRAFFYGRRAGQTAAECEPPGRKLMPDLLLRS